MTDYFPLVASKTPARPARWSVFAGVRSCFAALILACVLPVNANAQFIDESIVATEKYYKKEIEDAAAACDRARYDRAVLALKGLLGQIKKDIARSEADYQIKKAELQNPSWITKFYTNEKYQQWYKVTLELAESLLGDQLRLHIIRASLEDYLANLKPVNWSRCAPPATTTGPGTTPQATAVASPKICADCQILDDEIDRSRQRVAAFEADLSKSQTPESKQLLEQMIAAIKRNIAGLEQQKTGCDHKCMAPPEQPREAKRKQTPGQYYQKDVPPLRTFTPPIGRQKFHDSRESGLRMGGS